MDANLELMQKIRSQWAPAIIDACQSSSVPPAFLAGLIANESGGDPHAKRFEPGVFGALWQVLAGHHPAYGSISRQTLFAYAFNELAGHAVPLVSDQLPAFFADAFHFVDDLATSWGLTQIMGWHVLDHGIGVITIPDLWIPDRELLVSLNVLAGFAEHFQLDLSKDFAEMFTCWNTGQPNGKTADPEYVPNGIARMILFEQLAD